MPRESDLVYDSKLETKFIGQDTQHTSYQSIAGSQQRKTIVAEQWRRNRKIGDGTYGQVWLETCFAGPRVGEFRAVKKIPKIQANNVETDYTKELEAITKFSQAKASSRLTGKPHIVLVLALIYRQYVHCFVQSFGWYEDGNFVYIAMEYMEHGDLQRQLTKPYPEVEVQSIALQLLEGLQFMHENGFTHRDLKPSNILVLNLSPEWWIKIGDFGISKRVGDDLASMRTFVGTKGYLAPEVQGLYPRISDHDRPKRTEQGSYTSAVDIWALGEICFKLVANRAAFSAPWELVDYAVHGLEFPYAQLQEYDASDNCISFISSTMSALAANRPSAQKALMHAWVNAEGQDSSNHETPPKERQQAYRLSLADSQTFEATAAWSTLPDSTTMKPVSLAPKMDAIGPLYPRSDREEEAETKIDPMSDVVPSKWKHMFRTSLETVLSKAVMKTTTPKEIHERQGRASNKLDDDSQPSLLRRLFTSGPQGSLASTANSSATSSTITLSHTIDNNLVDPKLFANVSINSPKLLQGVLNTIKRLVVPESEILVDSEPKRHRLSDGVSFIDFAPVPQKYTIGIGDHTVNSRAREARNTLDT